MIVAMSRFGQLGNRLFHAAHLVAAACEYGVTLVNPSLSEYAEYFRATTNDLWCRYPATGSFGTGESRKPSPQSRRLAYKSVFWSARVLEIARLRHFPIRQVSIADDETCDLAGDSFREMATSRIPLVVSGWRFRSQMLLDKHLEVIRNHFEIVDRHRQHVDRLMRDVRRQANRVIGVHIRQGDYREWNDGKCFYSIEQYATMMRRLKSDLAGRDISFLVCGNTQLDRADFSGLNVQFGTGHLVEDMYALAETDLLIGPPSTFSGWASLWGDVPLQVMHTAQQEIDLSVMGAGSRGSGTGE